MPLVDKTCAQTEWFTPPRILEPVRAYFGGEIDLDPATSRQNPVGARWFCTEDDLTPEPRGWAGRNGLGLPWAFCAGANRSVRVFLNPPYGKEIRAWLAKTAEAARGGCEIVALLPGQRTEQRYWQEHLLTSALTAVVFVRKRVEFVDGRGAPLLSSDGRKRGNPYGSMLWIFNGSWARVVAHLGHLGAALRPAAIALPLHDGGNAVAVRAPEARDHD